MDGLQRPASTLGFSRSLGHPQGGMAQGPLTPTLHILESRCQGQPDCQEGPGPPPCQVSSARGNCDPGSLPLRGGGAREEGPRIQGYSSAKAGRRRTSLEAGSPTSWPPTRATLRGGKLVGAHCLQTRPTSDSRLVRRLTPNSSDVFLGCDFVYNKK